MISMAEISRHVWVCDPSYVELFIQDLAALDVSDAGVSAAAVKLPPPYDVREGVAHIEISGMILRDVPAAYKLFGVNATSAAEVGRAIELALLDDSVDSVMLDIDSPGGTLAGTAELAASIYSARDVKPINAHATDLAASAAYWIGAQAGQFTASQTAQIGSIGVYRVMVDSSEQAKGEGVKVHVIRSGAHKGAGVPGVEISAEQLAVEQENIEQAAQLFSEAVARGRGMSDEAATAIATGRTWLANDAHDLGLIDGIESAADAHTRATLQTETQLARLALAGKEESTTITVAGDAINTKGKVNMNDQNMVNDATDELATLKAELEAAQLRAGKAEAQAEAAAVSLAGVKESQKGEAIEKAVAEGRVTPAMRSSVDSYARKCGDDVAELASFLAALPVQTKTDTVGVAHSEQKEEKIDEALAFVSNKFNRDLAEVVALARVRAVTSDGMALCFDGTRVKLADIVKGN